MIEEAKKIEIARWLLDPEGRASLPANLDLLEKELARAGLKKIYEDIELPLAPILERMHKTGIGVNVAYLKKLEKELATETEKLVKNIYKIAGLKFNLNSPQQISKIIFDHLGVNAYGITKRKSGAWSTDAETLSEIANQHKIIPLILNYREVYKLNSTYVRPLIGLAYKTGRVHTTFLQTKTATGRLSSENPNLQNLPVTGRWAKKLRKAFAAKKGASFAALDYSQIELRVLASLSGDRKIINAFKDGLDIHRLTAARVFKIPIDKVTPEKRNLAKTLNFGIIYGMGPAAFARRSGLNLFEARKFIDEYFNDFVQVRRWQEDLLQKAHALGYVETLTGRRRFLPNINSQDRRLAAEAERAAINMPIQGLAADILKLAMIKSDQFLNRAGIAKKAALVLSIHDELLFEIDDDILKETVPALKKIIEKCYALKVPLVAEVKIGKNLGEMKKLETL
jgi:DNA polymerase-1